MMHFAYITFRVINTKLRHGLEMFKNRLKALKSMVAQEGLILTEAQIVALERKKEEDQAKGKIETELQISEFHPKFRIGIKSDLTQRANRLAYDFTDK